MWSVFSGSGVFVDPADPTTTVNGLQKGANTMRWSVTKGACINHVDLLVNNLKVNLSAGVDSSICTKSTILNAVPAVTGTTGEWTIISGSATFFPSRNDPKARIGGLSNDDNYFAWTITSNGCATVDTVRITVNAPQQANAGSDQAIVGSASSLNADPVAPPQGVGSWSLVAGGGDIDNIYNPQSSVTNLRRGANIFRWTVVKNGCYSTDEVTITNGQSINAEAGPDQEVCASTATLRANDPDVGIGQWSVFRGAGKIASPSQALTTVKDLGPGRNVFMWTIYYTNTTTSDTVAITNSQPSVANAGSYREICNNQFTLEGNIPGVGTPTWSVVSGQGSFANLHLPNSLVTNLSQGDNVLKYEIKNRGCSSVDTVRITNNLPTTAYAGTDEVLCTDSIELRPNTPTYGTAEWRLVQGKAFFFGNYAKKLAQGVNILEYRISNGTCFSSDTIHVTNSTPSKPNAGNDRIICTSSVTLSANIPQYGTGKWELIAGAGTILPADISNHYAPVTNLGGGDNRFHWVITNGGCQLFDEVIISNNYIQANAGLDNTICTDTLVIEANNASPGIGSWGIVGGSGSAQFDQISKPNTVVRNLDQGLNSITWTINNTGCSSIDTIKIVNNRPTKANAGVNRAVCDNFVVLSGNKPAIGTPVWSRVSGGGTFDDSTLPSARVDGLAFGKNIYRWTVSNNGCFDYDDVEIAFNTVYASVGNNQTLCSNTATLAANSALPGVGTWSIVGGTTQASFVDIHNPTTNVTNLGRGTNILRWSITNLGCTTSADVNVVNDSPSDPYAGNTQDICANTTTLDATAVTIGTGSWVVLTGGGTVTTPLVPKSAVTNLAQGDNVLRWLVVNNLCSVWDDVLIQNNTPSDPYAGDDFETCSNSIALKAAQPSYGTGSWSIVSGSGNIASPTNAESVVDNLKADQNVFKWRVVRGNCFLEDMVTVTNNTPTTANAGADIQDCKDVAVLDANVPSFGTAAWTIVTGSGVFASTTNPKTTITKLGFGDNQLRWTISKGTCFSSDVVMVFNKVPDQAKAGVDQIVCENYVTLNANDPTSGIGKWSVMSGLGEFEDASDFQSKVNNIGFLENVYKWTVQYGSCSTFDLVSVVSNKAWADAGADGVTYDGSYELAANKEDNTPGSWSVLAGQGTFADANNFNTIVSGLRNGVNTFRWTIDVDNCIAFDDMSVTYKVVPDAAFITNVDEGCSPLTVNFTNYTVGRDSTFLWNFDDGSTSTSRHVVHVFSNPGSYNVTLTAKGPDGIDDVSSKIITVREHPIAEFTATPEIVYVPGDVVRFYNFSTGAVKFNWNFGDKGTSVEQNPIYGYSDIGVYSVTLVTENIYGCTDSITKTDYITAKQQGFIVFPNAFTPTGSVDNGSGATSSVTENTVFKAISKFVDTYELQIFNQWGQLIFSSTDLTEGWNGEYKGDIVPQGVYVWKVTGKFLSGKEYKIVGDVMVIR